MASVERLQLSIQSLDELDNGIVALQFLKHLQRAALDCMDRPGDKTKREVTMKFTFSPAADQSGSADTADCVAEIKSKIPVHRSKTYEMGLSKAGFTFNRDVPENLNQSVLFPAAGNNEGKDS